MSYCYVTLLFSNNESTDYLEGVLLTGLGLRKQKVEHKLICLVTPDVKNDDRNLILKIWDEIIEISYISPCEGIKISSAFFDPLYFQINHIYLKVFTKLHIFNKNILHYDKVLFIDSDLIPIKDFDNIFEEYDTPAGWLELLKFNNNNSYSITWGEHSFKNNEIIPDDLTNQEKLPYSINAGLLLIKPDNLIYNNLLIKLVNTVSVESLNYDGSIKKFYTQLEQTFLTKEFSGQWHYMSHYYNSWGYHNSNCKSVHMAGLYYILNKQRVYSKTWLIQRNQEDIFNEKTNEIFLYSIKKYPFLKEILFNNLKFIILDKLISYDQITDFYYSLLTNKQKQIIKIKTVSKFKEIF